VHVSTGESRRKRRDRVVMASPTGTPQQPQREGGRVRGGGGGRGEIPITLPFPNEVEGH